MLIGLRPDPLDDERASFAYDNWMSLSGDLDATDGALVLECLFQLSLVGCQEVFLFKLLFSSCNIK
jgi:hypothetical protein